MKNKLLTALVLVLMLSGIAYSADIVNGKTEAYEGKYLSTVSLPGGNPCVNPSATLLYANGLTTATATTQVIASAANKAVYICNFTGAFASGGRVDSYGLVYGTGSNCVTNMATLYKSVRVASAPVFSVAGMITPASQSVCSTMVSNGAASVSFGVTYVQQ